jgi:hypothetical protein
VEASVFGSILGPARGKLQIDILGTTPVLRIGLHILGHGHPLNSRMNRTK